MSLAVRYGVLHVQVMGSLLLQQVQRKLLLQLLQHQHKPQRHQEQVQQVQQQKVTRGACMFRRCAALTHKRDPKGMWACRCVDPQAE